MEKFIDYWDCKYNAYDEVYYEDSNEEIMLLYCNHPENDEGWCKLKCIGRGKCDWFEDE